MAIVDTDLVVVIPGIMGSTLVRNGHEFWGLSPRTLARGIATLGRELEALRLPEGIGDNHPDDGVEPGRVMPDMHLVPGVWSTTVGYDALLTFLRRECGLRDGENLLAFAYDWRLSNRYTSRRLHREVAPMLARRRRSHPGAKVVFVCHSMGGLVARWFVGFEAAGADVRAILSIGTPHRGAVATVERLLHGIGGRLGAKLGLPEIARSLPSMYQLLPEYAFVEDRGDLYNATEYALPELDPRRVADGIRFHEEIDGRDRPLSPIHAIVGIEQKTVTTVRSSHGTLVFQHTIDGEDERGDGTVPRLSARPKAVAGDDSALHYVVAKHGALPSARGVFDQIRGVLTANPRVHKARPEAISVDVGDLLEAGASIPVVAHHPDPYAVLEARVVDEAGSVVRASRILGSSGAGTRREGVLAPIGPGGYELQVRRRHGSGGWDVNTVTTPFLVI
jgi:hypothetical protein